MISINLSHRKRVEFRLNSTLLILSFIAIIVGIALLYYTGILSGSHLLAEVHHVRSHRNPRFFSVWFHFYVLNSNIDSSFQRFWIQTCSSFTDESNTCLWKGSTGRCLRLQFIHFKILGSEFWSSFYAMLWAFLYKAL